VPEESNQAQEFIKRLSKLHTEKGDSINIEEIHSLMSDVCGDDYNEICKGIQTIAGKITSAKNDISHIEVNKISGDFIQDANIELDAIVKHAEEATNNILDAAEEIQSSLGGIDESKSQKITESINKIFEASNFQDITGQRINKIVTALVDIESCVNGLINKISGGDGTIEINVKGDHRADADLMNGPQLDTEAPTQEEIDKLLAES